MPILLECKEISMYTINVYNKNKEIIYNKTFNDNNFKIRFKSVVKTFEEEYNEFYMKVYTRHDDLIMDIF